MSLQVVLTVALVVYSVLMVAIVYFCMIADPDESKIAEFLSETLPKRTWNLLERFVDQRSLSIIGFLSDRILLLIYCTVVFGSWGVIFLYVYPWILSQSYVSHSHTIVGYFVFAACFFSWRYASNSSPGIITASNIHLYDKYPYDNLLFVANKTCPTRKIRKVARSKFDRHKYNENVARFDHFCGWIHNTVGAENYRWFLLFLFVHVCMCAYGTFVLSSLFLGVVIEERLLEVTFFNRATGEEIRADKWIISQYLFAHHTAESAVLILMLVMSVGLAIFLGYHLGLTCKNMTTNESHKWGEVHRWYDKELKRYKDAVKKGSPVYDASKSSQPKVSDGDVTCTPQLSSSKESIPKETEKKEIPEDLPFDPGPRPTNIYNRGLVENWKEVLFPLSLRGPQKSKDT